MLPRDSATFRSVDPDGATWGLEAHLLALAIDVLNIGNWQRTGKKGTPRPKPVQRPGVKDGRQTRRLGTASMSMEEMQTRQQAWSAGETEVDTDGP